MKLKELIEKLEGLTQEKRIFIEVKGKENFIVSLDSYRGYYDELSIDYSEEETGIKLVKDFLEECKSAVGKEFTGWKGGKYLMNESTPIWVSKNSCCDGLIIKEIVETDDKILIKTILEEDEE